MKYQIKEYRREELKEKFFWAVRRWINIDSHWNQGKENIILYYSLDQDKYLKRDIRNKQPIYNWILISHDNYEMTYLKNTIALRGEQDLSYTLGRRINGVWVKDDLYYRLMKFVNETFEHFFNNEVEEEPKSNNLF